jgi:hypothetical protein
VAAAPTSSKPQYIYPDGPGASQSCVVPMDPDKKRYSVAAGAELTLTDCNTVQGKIFNVSPSRISVAGKPNLCVNISAGAHQRRALQGRRARLEVVILYGLRVSKSRGVPARLKADQPGERP